MLLGIHHAAIICSDYERSRHFYTNVLGIPATAEHYRENRKSYKLDLRLPDGCEIELFSFEGAPDRLSYPEAKGLRHLAFEVSSVDDVADRLRAAGVKVEDVRVDEYTGKKYTFFFDPDELPLELKER